MAVVVVVEYGKSSGLYSFSNQCNAYAIALQETHITNSTVKQIETSFEGWSMFWNHGRTSRSN
jgi:exonuclease III